ASAGCRRTGLECRGAAIVFGVALGRAGKDLAAAKRVRRRSGCAGRLSPSGTAGPTPRHHRNTVSREPGAFLVVAVDLGDGTAGLVDSVWAIKLSRSGRPGR